MPRQFGDGQHRQEAQHPPDTHGLPARKLFRAFARTVPKEEQLTNASAALPSMDMPALRGATVAHSTRSIAPKATGARPGPGGASSTQRTPEATMKALPLRGAQTGREHSGDCDSTTL